MVCFSLILILIARRRVMVCFSLILINTNSQEEGNRVCFSLILIARRTVMVSVFP